MDVTDVRVIPPEELRHIAQVCKEASELIQKQVVAMNAMAAQMTELRRSIERAKRALDGA